MAEFGVGFKVFADASQFQREMRQAVESSKQVQRGLKDIGVNIGRFIGAGAIASWFTGTAQAAQDLRDEVQKIGGTVDGTTARVAAFGDGLDEVKKTAVGMSMAVLGFFNQIGEWLAWLPNRLTGVTKAQEELAAKIAKDTQETLKRIEEGQKANSPEKLAAAEKALQAERRRNLLETESIQGRINILNEEWRKLNEEIDKLSVNTVARKERELELEKVTAEIRKANADQDKRVNEELSAFFDSVEAGSKALLEKEQERKKVAAELAALAEQEAAAKANQLKIESDLKKLNDASYAEAINFMSGSTLDRQKVQEASDETLREILRRKQGNLQSLGAGGGSLAFDDNYFTRIQIQNDIQRVKAELDLRNGLRNTVERSGLDVARRSFGGDPFTFERLIEQFVQDGRTSQDLQRETVDLLRDMKRQQQSGIAVVNLNKK